MKHYHFEEVTSTNDVAKELLETESFVVVTADFQSKGRGRNNHSWVGISKANLYYSIGRSYDSPPDDDDIVALQIIGSLAVINTLSKLTFENIYRMKYPNDVLVKYINGYGKIAGILVEHTFSGSSCTKSVLGIGINVAQEDFPELIANNPVSLKMLGFDITSELLREELTRELLSLLAEPTSKIFSLWKQQLDILGKEVAVLGKTGRYTAENILEDGRLVLFNHDTNDTIIIDNGDSVRYEIG